MAFPVDGIPRPGLDVPGMKCPLCGHGAVYWLDGKGAWNLDAPLPHFKCWWCCQVFHAPHPELSKQHENSIKKSNFVNLWRNC